MTIRLQTLNDNILFQFVDQLNSQNQFKKTQTESGIILAGDTFDSSAKEARWAVVESVGPKVEGIAAGDHILIPALRWTEGVNTGDRKVWMTKVNEVVAKRTAGAGPLIAIGDWVLFKRVAQERTKMHGSLVVVEAHDPTIRGTIDYVGPTVDSTQVQPGMKLLFVDPNFLDTAKTPFGMLSFVRESTILAVEE